MDLDEGEGGDFPSGEDEKHVSEANGVVEEVNDEDRRDGFAGGRDEMSRGVEGLSLHRVIVKEGFEG